MSDIALRREHVDGFFKTAKLPHPGLWLSRGLREWKEDVNRKGEDFQGHIQRAAKLSASPVYWAAYDRWVRQVVLAPSAASWIGKLCGRLFVGMGGASVIETAITLSRTYGIPVIPGSAQKGLAQAYARASGLPPDSMDVLFGKEGEEPESFDAGYVLFHDAWWTTSADLRERSCPLATEVATVHHPEYYKDGGATPPTDFDSPVPNAQIAACGSFLFSVECADAAWAHFAMDLLRRALEEWGIGGKTSAGYGRFEPDPVLNRQLNAAREAARLSTLSADDRLRTEVERMTEQDLAERLGKDRNKTRKEISEHYGDVWEQFIGLVAEHHGALIRGWEKSSNGNQKKAFKTVFGAGEDEGSKEKCS